MESPCVANSGSSSASMELTDGFELQSLMGVDDFAKLSALLVFRLGILPSVLHINVGLVDKQAYIDACFNLSSASLLVVEIGSKPNLEVELVLESAAVPSELRRKPH